MRITGGELRGRRLRTPPSLFVRPTQDMVREAVFSMLAKNVVKSNFLDLFAGTGSVGIEAWSRGAKSVNWVEKDAKTARILKDNIDNLCTANPGRVYVKDVIRWISGAKPAMGLFDIVYADPPYASEKQTDGMEEVMKLLIQSETLAPDAIFVAEQGRDSPLTPSTREWIRIIERNYGHSRISIFKRNGGQDECRFHE